MMARSLQTLQTLTVVLCLLAGIHSFAFCRRNAREAVRQIQRIMGWRFPEGIYVVAFKYGGLLLAGFSLLVLLGLVR
jgi:hypothetical protein